MRDVRINGNKSRVWMHRLILEKRIGYLAKNKLTDHINGKILDNRNCNLRIASSAENNRNRIKRQGCSSKYKGVSWDDITKKWRAIIVYNYKRICLGRFISETDAAKAYDNAAKQLHGEYAYLNLEE